MKDKIGIYLDKENKEKLKILAIQTNTSASEIINELVTEYLLKLKKQSQD